MEYRGCALSVTSSFDPCGFDWHASVDDYAAWGWCQRRDEAVAKAKRFIDAHLDPHIRIPHVEPGLSLLRISHDR